jgi:carbonic anhydrase
VRFTKTIVAFPVVALLLMPAASGVGEEKPDTPVHHYLHKKEQPHTVDGKHFPMEMHLVHKADDGTLGVVAVFIQAGNEHNKALDPVWNMLPDKDTPSRESNKKIDAMNLLPTNRGYYSYDGSLTTPPCTEQVKWAVLMTPVSLSEAQIRRFREVIHGNNRPVQPLNGRKVLRSH